MVVPLHMLVTCWCALRPTFPPCCHTHTPLTTPSTVLFTQRPCPFAACDSFVSLYSTDGEGEGDVEGDVDTGVREVGVGVGVGVGVPVGVGAAALPDAHQQRPSSLPTIAPPALPFLPRGVCPRSRWW